VVQDPAVALWFIGEFVGAIVGAIVIGRSDMCTIYMFAALGAVAGAVVAVAITAIVPPGDAAAA
jgi:zinc transporter ZupT